MSKEKPTNCCDALAEWIDALTETIFGIDALNNMPVGKKAIHKHREIMSSIQKIKRAKSKYNQQRKEQ